MKIQDTVRAVVDEVRFTSGGQPDERCQRRLG